MRERQKVREQSQRRVGEVGGERESKSERRSDWDGPEFFGLLLGDWGWHLESREPQTGVRCVCKREGETG